MENKKITLYDLPRVICVKYPARYGYPEESRAFQLDLFAAWDSKKWCLSYCDGNDGYLEMVVSWIGTDIDKLVAAASKWFKEHPTNKNESGDLEYPEDMLYSENTTSPIEIE